MANDEHVARLREGVEQWNEWRSKNRAIRPDLGAANLRMVYLSDADLHGAYLSDADLHGAYLRGADLSATRLSRADFSWADLNAANLSGAHLGSADLRGAKLREANLRRANLRGANLSEGILFGADLSWAQLRGADFSQAELGETAFGCTDLSETKGLASCVHYDPSILGIDTIVKSGGNIPEAFLRGCGVAEPFIVNMKSLIGAMEPIQFYSCFISYSSHDQAFAARLHADLLAKNLRCWFAPEDLKIGDHFQERIEESIRVHDKVMIILSEASVESRWVEREVNAAREREGRDKRIVLFPIRIDDAVMNAPQPWAADIRRNRHIGDFTGWQSHDSYVKAFDRLMRDLKTE